MTSPPDFLQLHNPQPIITHHHPTAAAALYQNAIDTTMNYNCARLQYDLALSVITQLPQQRAAKAPVLAKWNHIYQEKEGKYSVSGKLCCADCILVHIYVYVYENKDESQYQRGCTAVVSDVLKVIEKIIPLEFQHLPFINIFKKESFRVS